MNDEDKNNLREMPQPFRPNSGHSLWSESVNPSHKPMRAKVFKSGNSLALRLPSALGLEAGMEMEIKSDNMGGYNLREAPDATRKFNIDAIWGIGKDLGLQPISPEDRIFDDVKRPWDDPAWPGWGGDEV